MRPFFIGTGCRTTRPVKQSNTWDVYMETVSLLFTTYRERGEKERKGYETNSGKRSCYLSLFLLCACAAEEEAQYNEKTNQTVSVHGIRFQIPEQWNKSYENREYLEYSIWDEEEKYPERILAITLEKEQTLKEDAESTVEDLEFAKEDDEIDYRLGDISQTATSIGKLDAEIIEFDGKVKDKKYLYKDVLIEVGNGIVHLDFCSLDKTGMEDFDRVISSITLAE